MKWPIAYLSARLAYGKLASGNELVQSVHLLPTSDNSRNREGKGACTGSQSPHIAKDASPPSAVRLAEAIVTIG